MNDPAMEELISAYLDGEVTPDEQALVERALAQSDRCRRVYEEFVALRASLQGLPQERLDAEFFRGVMDRIAVAEIALARPTATEQKGVGATEVPQPMSGETMGNRGRRWARRAPVWLGLIAAAILLAVLAYPLHLTILAWLDAGAAPTDSETPVPTIPQQRPSDPLAPNSALAGNEGEDVQVGRPQDGTPPGLDAETNRDSSETPPARNIAEDASTPQSGRQGPPKSEDGSARQIARGVSEDAERRLTPAVPPVDLGLDYSRSVASSSPEIYVIRLAASPEALQRDVFGELLRQSEIAFLSDEDDAPRAGPASSAAEVVLASGRPSQLDALLAALRARPNDFRPEAVYLAPRLNFLEFVVAVTYELPADPKELVAPPGAARGDSRTSRNLDQLRQLLLGGDSVFAWRAPPVDLALVDRLFPIPDANAGRREQSLRRGAETVHPDLIADVVFVLTRAPRP